LAKHLEDIGKDAKDLLTEGFPNDGAVKVTAQTKSLGFNHKISLNRSLKRDKTGVREVVTAAFEPKYELKEHNLEFTGKLSTTNDITVGTSVRDLVGSGSKVEINVTKSDRDGINGVASASYRSELLALKGKFTYPVTPKRPIKINAEAVWHHGGSNSSYGGGLDVNLEGDIARIFAEGVFTHSAKDSQYKGLLRYDVYDSTVLWGVSFWQRVSDRQHLAFDLTSEDNASKTTFTTGTEYKVDDKTTVKGKWKLIKQNDRVDYRLGVSLKQKLSTFVTATLGSDLNPRSFLGSGEGDPNSYGIEIKFQD